jgi:membrane protein implicated in regulation of membrane protease activity
MVKYATALAYVLVVLALGLVLLAGPTRPEMTLVVLLAAGLIVYVTLLGWRVIRKRSDKSNRE